MNKIFLYAAIIAVAVGGTSFFIFGYEKPAQDKELLVGEISGATQLTRNHPATIKGILDPGPDDVSRLLNEEIENVRALGANTMYIYVDYWYDGGELVLSPVHGQFSNTREEEAYKTVIQDAKRKGFAVHLTTSFGSGQNKPFGVPLEEFLEDAKQADLKWAEIAEEYKVETFAPSSEMDWQIFREYFGANWSRPELHDEAARISNKYHDDVLPDLRKFFKGKIIYQSGIYNNNSGSVGYDIFGTGLNQVSREVSNFRDQVKQVYEFAETNAKRQGSDWMVTELWIPIREHDGTAYGGELMKSPSGVPYIDTQHEFYRIAFEEYENWDGDLKPVGLGFTAYINPTSGIRGRPAEALVAEFFNGLGSPQTQQATSGVRTNPELLSEAERSGLPECDNTPYHVAPVDLSKVMSITPMGNVEPPEHTIPTNHMYMHFGAQGQSDERFDLAAPADAWVTSVRKTPGFLDPEDYTIYFAVCRDVYGYFNHVKGVSQKVQEILERNGCDASQTSCNVQSMEKVSEGDLLGAVGGLQANFDFGTIDMRRTNGFINPARYAPRTLHIACPLDYYSEPSRSQIANLLQSVDKSCGNIMQDVPGTLQGNWFFGDGNEFIGGSWVNMLFFGYDRVDPSLAVIAAGGVFTEPLRWKFSPEDSGKSNVMFDKIKPDGDIYCYDERINDPNGIHNKGPTGKIIVQLVGETQLKIERQDGSCSGSFVFSNPTIYDR